MLATLRTDNAWTVNQQRTICEIPAPPFKEAARAAEYKRRFEALGLRARVDAIGNVLAERPGTGTGPTIVLAGHLDTVFPEGTDVRVRDQGARMVAPGIGDDCRGLAVVLAYSALGGLWSSVSTSTVSTLLHTVPPAVVVVAALYKAGGAESIWTSVADQGNDLLRNT